MDLACVPLLDAIRSLAFVGDLSMGQPIDHSPRAAWMAVQLVRAAGGDEVACAQAAAVSLLRWSGCTANAPDFAQLFGDDVGGRKALLAARSAGSGFRAASRGKPSAFRSLSRIHCEVSATIAAQLGLDETTRFALGHLFESYDGSGAPEGLAGDAVPASVYLAAIAGDLDIFGRLYGVEQARALIGQRAGALYPRALTAPAVAHAADWLAALDADPGLSGRCSLGAAFAGRETPLELLAHVVDLKLPWMTGHSLRVAQLARDAAQTLGLDDASQQRLYRAGLIHGMGRASVPNAVWDTPGPLPRWAWERVRLAPYWTGRAARQIGSLADEAQLASCAYERLDGSGYFREADAGSSTPQARILAAAAAWAALRSARPWREAFSEEQAAAILQADAAAGRLDAQAVRALLRPHAAAPRRVPAPSAPLLSERERDVLRWISLGASNKVVAQKLAISPSTVRTHVENAFRKLESSTRAAATLKATQLGLL